MIASERPYFALDSHRCIPLRLFLNHSSTPVDQFRPGYVISCLWALFMIQLWLWWYPTVEFQSIKMICSAKHHIKSQAAKYLTSVTSLHHSPSFTLRSNGIFVSLRHICNTRCKLREGTCETMGHCRDCRLYSVITATKVWHLKFKCQMSFILANLRIVNLRFLSKQSMHFIFQLVLEHLQLCPTLNFWVWVELRPV